MISLEIDDDRSQVHRLNESDLERAIPALTLPLDRLVKMKLTSFRRKEQVHIQDMISLGLIDSTWVQNYSPELAARLQ